ncbi:MAG: M12 family metallo-peptidase [Candidatus Hydrogenedentes bacterium]|nr:M12 family metallo-peptidase [Candidatus Hydrogenedentota bacterium]
MTFTRFALLPVLLVGVLNWPFGVHSSLHKIGFWTTSTAIGATGESKGSPIPDIRVEPTSLTFDCGGKMAGGVAPAVSLFALSTIKSSGPNAPINVQIAPEGLRAAAALKSAVFMDVPLADGSIEDFAVTRFDVFTADAKVVSTDGATERALPVPQASYFDGHGLNDPDKHIFLSIVEGRDVWMMVSSSLIGTSALGPDTTEGKSSGEHTLVRVEDFGSSGFECFADALPENAAKLVRFAEPSASAAKSTDLLETEVLVDVGNGLYRNRFGSSSSSATTYVGNLFGAVSSIYRRDTNINVRIKQLVVWTSADPFGGGDSDEQLDAYVTYNNNNRPIVQRDLCHLLADLDFAGGIAYLDVLCDKDFGYAVSNIDTGYSFPPVGYVWDVDVVAHETGHNFGSPHTHCYSPPIDCCFQQSGCSGCPNAVPQVGTIMSYCHITPFLSQLRFDTRVATLIRQNAEAASCITPVLSGNEFIIYNEGSGALQVTSMAPVASAPWLTLSPPVPFTVGTGAIQIVEVNVNCNGVPSSGATAFVRINSNDPNESPYPGDVQITVIGDCLLEVSPAENSFDIEGGTGTIDVIAECEWTAESDQPWAQITSGTSGDGDGTINYSVAANGTTGTRTAHIIVPGSAQVHTITQEGIPCTYSIAATSGTSFPSSGGSGTIGMTSLDGCAWTAQADKTWVSFPLGASGVGSGTIHYDVNSNGTLASRTAKITVPGAAQEIVITQSGLTCTYQFSSSNVTYSGAGGSGTVSLLSSSPCFWSLESDQPWLQITSNGSGSGTKVVGYTVLPNETLSSRTANLIVEGTLTTFFVFQGPVECGYDFDPNNVVISASGGTGVVSLDTQAPCEWTAVSDQSWLTLTSATSGTGDANIQYSVDATTSGFARTAHISVGDVEFLVAQEGLSCNFQLWPPATNFGFNGGAGTVNVQALAVCDWTAESSADWVTITSGANGTGNGAPAYSVAPNLSIASRMATITIPGTAISHTISQGGSNCLEGVKWPDGGESWKQNAKRKVSWEQGCLPCSEIVIELWRNGAKVKLLKKAGPNDGKQKVTMKSSIKPDNGYKIRIRCATDPSKFVESDSNFSVTAAR